MLDTYFPILWCSSGACLTLLLGIGFGLRNKVSEAITVHALGQWQNHRPFAAPVLIKVGWILTTNYRALVAVVEIIF